MMRVLIVGSRNIPCFNISSYIPPETDHIISGGAKGIDSIAEAYADLHGIPKIIVRPQYQVYGRAAPIKRNEVMVDMADYIIAVWDGLSKGTKFTIDYAKKKGKMIQVILI